MIVIIYEEHPCAQPEYISPDVHQLNWEVHQEPQVEVQTWPAKPPSNNNSKENYGFKSIAPAPQVKELKFFEDGLINLAKEIKFEYKHNHFQTKLNKDVKEIKNENRVLVAGDKSTNFHKMAPQKYTELLDKSIQKDYKKHLHKLSQIYTLHMLKLCQSLNSKTMCFKPQEGNLSSLLKITRKTFKITQLAGL